MAKKIFLFILSFSVVFGFNSFPLEEIKHIAQKVNTELFKTYKKPDTKKSKTVRYTNTIIKPVKRADATIKHAHTITVSAPLKINHTFSITISKKSGPSLKVFKLPYLSLKDILIDVIGSRNDMGNALCKIRYHSKLMLIPCKDIEKRIKRRNALLNEFLSNLLKFKKDMEKNQIFYDGKFNCGFLYKYYTYNHYSDCDELIQMLSGKEKKELYSYVNFVLGFNR